jgi:WD40 repeat protein
MIGTRRNLWSATAHEGAVRGVCCDERGEYVFSCGLDKTVKMWSLNPDEADSNASTGWEGKFERKEVKVAVSLSPNALTLRCI